MYIEKFSFVLILQESTLTNEISGCSLEDSSALIGSNQPPPAISPNVSAVVLIDPKNNSPISTAQSDDFILKQGRNVFSSPFMKPPQTEYKPLNITIPNPTTSEKDDAFLPPANVPTLCFTQSGSITHSPSIIDQNIKTSQGESWETVENKHLKPSSNVVMRKHLLPVDPNVVIRRHSTEVPGGTSYLEGSQHSKFILYICFFFS